MTDTIPAQIADWTWVCSPPATSCDGVTGSNTNFTDVVDLPSGASITYLVTANISAGAIGNLTNTVNISVPAGYTDPIPGNNSDFDTDLLVTSNCIPYLNIGTSPNGTSTTVITNGFLTLRFCAPSPLPVVGSHAGPDLVYYPDPSVPTLQMDIVILQIGNGANWYTILIWGDGFSDANTDINPADCPSEIDNCLITLPLTNPPGISIDLDDFVPPEGPMPPGTYPYIRIISLPDSGDGVSVDAISVIFP